MRKWSRVSIIIVLGIFILCGCSKNVPNQTTEVEEESKKIQIGISFDTFVIERWVRDRDIFVSTATELGAEVNTQNANGSIEEQISQIEYLIEKKMDVIVVITCDSNAISEVVNKAISKEIKVIAYDRLINGVDLDLYITSDSEQVGRLMAEYALENLPADGTIGIIMGSPLDYNVVLLEKGIDAVFKDKDVNIQYKEYAENWDEEVGFQVVSETLNQGLTVDVLICGNDNIAGQAIKALAEKRMAGSVYVIGQDANTDACQRIVEGTQMLTIYKSVDKMAAKTAEYAVKLGCGEEVKTELTYDNAGIPIPLIEIDPIAVTSDNMDEIITNQFHSDEEIYLNVR